MMVNLPCLMGSWSTLRYGPRRSDVHWTSCAPTSFVPPIHTPSASQAPRRDLSPTDNTTASYSSCFSFDFTDQTSSMMVLIDSVDALPSQILIGLSTDAADPQLHHVRVSFPEPCPASDPFSGTRQGSGNIMFCSVVVVMPLRKLSEVLCLSASSPDYILFPFLGSCI